MSVRSYLSSGRRAFSPATMPSISSWYSASSFGQNIRSADALKNAQSRFVDPSRKCPRAFSKSSISAASSHPCWNPISRGVPSRCTLIQPFVSTRVALASSRGAGGGAWGLFEHARENRARRTTAMRTVLFAFMRNGWCQNTFMLGSCQSFREIQRLSSQNAERGYTRKAGNSIKVPVGPNKSYSAFE